MLLTDKLLAFRQACACHKLPNPGIQGYGNAGCTICKLNYGNINTEVTNRKQ